jgi:NTE family protein
VLVQINPIERAELPRSARDIDNRLNEITFNSSLLRELRAISFVGRMIENGKLAGDEYTHARMHRIEASDQLGPLSASSKLNTEWPFLLHLRDIGRETAAAWLDAHAASIGASSTLDLHAMFE